MNLNGVDLNLMRALDALHAEGSVSRAAARLGIGQPAMSNALARLRSLFKDELFLRQGRSMVPTERALALAPLARRILDSVEEAVASSAPFVPGQSRRTLAVSGGDYALFVLLPALMKRLQQEAAGVDLRIRFAEKGRLFDLLEDGTLDLALGVFDDVPKRIVAEPVFRERFVGLARAAHPLTQQRLTAARFAALNHVLVTERGDERGAVDDALARLGLQRRVALSVPNVTLLPGVLNATDLVVTTGERVARALVAESRSLATFDLPIPLPGWTMSVLRSRRKNADSAAGWLAALIQSVGGGV